jgi:hypothetical protein
MVSSTRALFEVLQGVVSITAEDLAQHLEHLCSIKILRQVDFYLFPQSSHHLYLILLCSYSTLDSFLTSALIPALTAALTPALTSVLTPAPTDVE